MRRIIPLVALLLGACGGGSSLSGNLPDGSSSNGLGSSAGGAGTSGAGGASSTGTTGASGGSTPANFLFSPYKDVTISANWNTNVISTAVSGTITPLLQAAPQVKAVSWAFATGECGSENWGGITPAALISANLASFQSAGVSYVLSTGGAAGAFTCGTDAGFSAFLDKYASPQLAGVDFDIEAGQTTDEITALVQRVKAAQANPKYAKLRFSFTLATLAGNTPQSLGPLGIDVMNAIKAEALTGELINLMTMDYGSASATNCTMGTGSACEMGQSAVQAANNLNTAYGIAFDQIELTPMIGGNDSASETFTTDDVATVTAFAKSKGLAGLHIWSLDRDKDCPAGSASPTCNSYGAAGTLGFTKAFMDGL